MSLSMETASLSGSSRSPVAATGRISRAVLAEIPVLLVIACLASIAVVANIIAGVPGPVQWTNSLTLFGLFTFLYAVAAHFAVLIHTVVVKKQSLRRTDTWRAMVTTLWAPRKTVSFVLVCLGLAFFMPVFVTFKQAIPILNPFSWDPIFMEWDRWMHFGRHPFEWLQPYFGRPYVTKGLDVVYLLWIHVMWVTVIWQAWHGSRESETRSQYLLAFVLTWILVGTVGAILLSSAGPVYFAEVTGATEPYGSLMAYLQSVDADLQLRALMLQDYLWEAYQSPDEAMFAGISAMPSMHIAIVVLNSFLGFSINRWLGWAYTVFGVAIFIGSVHLAWHYAVDGYVALVAVAAIWFLSGKLVRWWRRKIGYHKPNRTGTSNRRRA